MQNRELSKKHFAKNAVNFDLPWSNIFLTGNAAFFLRYFRAMTAARHEWSMSWDKQKNYQRRFRSAKVFRFCACRQHNCVPIRANFSAEDQSSWRVAVLQPQVLKRSWKCFCACACMCEYPSACNKLGNNMIKRNCVGSTWAGGEVNLVDVGLIKFQAYVWCISRNNARWANIHGTFFQSFPISRGCQV